jgi:hypothetical protein
MIEPRILRLTALQLRNARNRRGAAKISSASGKKRQTSGLDSQWGQKVRRAAHDSARF